MPRPPKPSFRRIWLPVAAAVMMTITVSSCSKIPVNAPDPITILHSFEQFPMQRYLDSSFALAIDTIYLTLSTVTISGQAEFAYAFRTSAPAAITSLALMLPDSGFSHTVTLWDSATGAVLAQADVPTLNPGHWTSVSLALMNQAVPIQPGKGYIVGYNSRAVGNALDVAAPGNTLYLVYGIYDFSQGPAKSTFRPIMPFTEGLISFEGTWLVDYDAPLTGPIFPGGIPADNYTNSVFGVIDIGYIAAP